jgi:hypothetical protein
MSVYEGMCGGLRSYLSYESHFSGKLGILYLFTFLELA